MNDNNAQVLDSLNNDPSLTSMLYKDDDNHFDELYSNSTKYFDGKTFALNLNNISAYYLSLNCCSLLSKIEEVKLFLNEVRFKLPEVILLQEIFTFPDFFDPYIPGYNFYHKKRSKSKGGGVGVYVRTYYDVEEIPSIFNENVFESIALKIKNPDKTYGICNFYRPPQSDFHDFLDSFSQTCHDMNNLGIPLIIACDSNVNILKDNFQQKSFIGEALSNGFVNFITSATRISHNSKSAIDQMFSNSPCLIKQSGIIIDSPSDHFWTFAAFEVRNKSSYSNPNKKRSFSAKNVELFKEKLSSHPWNELSEIYNVDDAAIYFTQNFLTIFDESFPLVERKCNRRKQKIEPWFTNGLLISRKRKLHLYNVWKSSGKESHKSKFNSYRNVFNKMKNEAKRRYFASELSRTTKSSKYHWSLLKKACGLNRPSSSTENIEIFESNNKITDPVKVSNNFNDYFASIGEQISKNIPHSKIDYKKYLPPSDPNSFNFMEMGPFRFLQIVDNLQDKSTQDVNEVSVWLIKKVSHIIAEPLSHVFDLSIRTGIFPQIFKCSKVCPIYKRKGSVNIMSNYRPISIVNSFGKILEKYAADELLRFFTKNNIFSKHQHGFFTWEKYPKLFDRNSECNK